MSLSEELANLAAMHMAGHLSDEEFVLAKQAALMASGGGDAENSTEPATPGRETDSIVSPPDATNPAHCTLCGEFLTSGSSLCEHCGSQRHEVGQAVPLPPSGVQSSGLPHALSQTGRPSDAYSKENRPWNSAAPEAPPIRKGSRAHVWGSILFIGVLGALGVAASINTTNKASTADNGAVSSDGTASASPSTSSASSSGIGLVAAQQSSDCYTLNASSNSCPFKITIKNDTNETKQFPLDDLRLVDTSGNSYSINANGNENSVDVPPHNAGDALVEFTANLNAVFTVVRSDETGSVAVTKAP